MLVAQVVMVGAVVSRTMNEAVQVLKLPARSVAVMVTVLVPRPTRVPMAGLCVTLVALQLSAATTALVKVGAVVSRTMNEAVQVLVLPFRSATRTVTVLVPRPTSVPMVGLWLMETAVQLSLHDALSM